MDQYNYAHFIYTGHGMDIPNIADMEYNADYNEYYSLNVDFELQPGEFVIMRNAPDSTRGSSALEGAIVNLLKTKRSTSEFIKFIQMKITKRDQHFGFFLAVILKQPCVQI